MVERMMQISCRHKPALVSIVLFFLTLLIPAQLAGSTVSNPAGLTDAEFDWLKQHPVIRLAPDPGFAPIEFFDARGVYSGIGADYLHLVEKKLGVEFEIVRCENWEEVIAKAKRREIDILNAVVQSPQREEYLLFADPYLTIPSVIITRKTVTRELTLEMLKGMHVVMVSGYGYADIIKNRYPSTDVELVPNLQTALRKTSFGMADALIGDLATASYYIEQDGLTNLRMAGECDPPNTSGFAVRSDWPLLEKILEKGVLMITEQERNEIYKKWIHLGSTSTITSRDVLTILMLPGVLALLALIVFLLWSRMLNQKLRKQTSDLNREIEERKQVEFELRASRKRNTDLVENSTDWIWEFDENEIFTYSSPRVKDLLGYEPEEMIGTSAFSPMAGPEAERVMNEFLEYKAKREPFSHIININRHKDGHEVVIESSGLPIIDEDGTYRGYRGIDRDITIRSKLEESLRHGQKMKAIGTLAGGIAHDFNNILSALIGFAEIAKIETSGNSKLSGYIEEILNASHRAKELVKQILTFSSKTIKTKAPVKPAPVVREALKLIRASLPSTIVVREVIEDDTGYILADPTNIHQVVINLCTNAMQAMENQQGVISVTLKNIDFAETGNDPVPRNTTGKFVELTVSDTGHGMDSETIQRVFEPYFTTRETGSGSGIGLAVVHGIIEGCAGFIDIESEPGIGTTFKIYFPYKEHKEPKPDAVEHQSLPGGTESILVIDDEKTVARVLEKSLQRLGYSVTMMTSSDDALELFTASPGEFDLVITDQTMPSISGLELATKMLELRPNLPIILCTGYSAIVDEEEAVKLGVTRFLFKPVPMTTMVNVVRDTLDEKKNA
jgi:two-component system cell cycle sensor histidine kinase/response regulator CckA